MEGDDEKQPDVTLKAPQTFDPNALARAMERVQQTGAAALTGGELIPRRRVTFTVDADVCAPGIFLADFQLTLEALTNAEEMKLLRGITDAAESANIQMRASMYAINGTRLLAENSREFLWEALAAGGRQLVLMMYQQIGSITPGALKKAQETTTLS